MQDILTYINTGGVVALLVVALYLYQRGEVLPTAVVLRIIPQVVKEVIAQLVEDGYLKRQARED